VNVNTETGVIAHSAEVQLRRLAHCACLRPSLEWKLLHTGCSYWLVTESVKTLKYVY